MRRWILLLLLAGMALPARAAKTLSIEQLEQLLATLRGKPDARAAQQIAEFELAERVNPTRLARWETDFPGPHMHEALTKLADQAAFAQSPAADLYPTPAPDMETQERMLSQAVEYLKTTMRRMPNFYATRETTHFEDTPSQQVVFAGGPNRMGGGARGSWVNGIRTSLTEYKGLHIAGQYSAMVTFRDGAEVHDEDAAKNKKPGSAPGGLTSNGEFGPILEVVLVDAMRSQVTWLHWEQASNGPVGVFHYTVPEEQSHYGVRIPNGNKQDELFPAYHGDIAVDPATGEILRLTAEAELKPPYDSMRTAIAVEYAPVAIGEQTYVCPVRSTAYSKIPVGGAVPGADGSVMVQTQLNDVEFTHYHLFRAESHIVADTSGKGDTTAPDASGPAIPVNATPDAAGAAPASGKQAPAGAPKGDHDQ
jgi:hypothetical protein